MNETLNKMLGQLALLKDIFYQELDDDQLAYHWEIGWKLSQLQTLIENELTINK